ncbi:MAG: sugar isomerase domain-containing protein [Alphaproteobacteria bacterium]|nr:MAG: sugar isomerase domain-containing protein [Alphaproteobacteria bacterium]
MTHAYADAALSRLSDIVCNQSVAFDAAVTLFSDAIMADRIIWAFGAGHSQIPVMELFARAGGLANVGPMLDGSVSMHQGARRASAFERAPGIAKLVWDRYRATAGDLMIIVSNSGINASAVEMAMLAQEAGLKVIAVTSVAQSSATEARHESGHKLMDLADVVLDNGAPYGDNLLETDGYAYGGFSSLSGLFLLQAVQAEAIARCLASGHAVPLFQNQNSGGRENPNAALFAKYESRVGHL